jgi:heme exporter protein C
MLSGKDQRVKERGTTGTAILVGASAALMIAALCLVFLYAPEERDMGNVQRIFYFHVPCAWVGFLAFFVTFICSIGYLRTRARRWDHVAQCSTEIGLIFTTLVLLTGPIWAKSAWGIWWTWDLRLTTTLIIWLVYVAYLMIRSFAASESQGAQFASVIGIVGFLNIPITFLAVDWWTTQHPQGHLAIESGGLEPAMRYTLFFCVATFTVLYALLLKERLALRRSEADLEELRDNAEMRRR